MKKIFLLCVLLCIHVISFSVQSKARVAILGASGYTGAELMRLLTTHPHVSVDVLTSTERNAGKEFKSIFPQYSYCKDLPKLSLWEDARKEIEDCDVAFCCLPHGTTQEIINELASNSKKVKIIDLSADFRLENVETYAEWYGKPHAAPKLQNDAVYGLCEMNRAAIKGARILANPGCYPTAAQLPLLPLIKAGDLIKLEDIIIDAKSGTTGAGKFRRGKNSSIMTCNCNTTSIAHDQYTDTYSNIKHQIYLLLHR